MITQRRLSKGRARAGRFRAAMALFLAIMSAAAMMSTPVHAEFELKGARVERGEVELEYRGSAHSGLPRAEDGDAPVRQSHDIEYEVGVTDRFAVSAVLTWEELDGFAFEHSATTVEAQFELIDKSYLAVSVLTEVQSARATGRPAGSVTASSSTAISRNWPAPAPSKARPIMRGRSCTGISTCRTRPVRRAARRRNHTAWLSAR
jgi:hypothetical protein